MAEVLDLDVFVSEERSIKLGGKKFDLTNIPFHLSAQVYNLEDAIQKITASNKISPEVYEQIFKLIFSLLKHSDSELQEEWLRNQITATRFTKIIPFIFSALFDEGKKNEENQAPEQSQEAPQ